MRFLCVKKSELLRSNDILLSNISKEYIFLKVVVVNSGSFFWARSTENWYETMTYVR